MNTTNQSFLVNKTNLFESEIRAEKIDPIVDNEVLFQVETFSFTSNNITYGVVGEKIGYWNFFPVKDPKGIIPCWGFAKVVESKNEYIIEGDYYYGYWPMASYLKVRPSNINPYGFVDGTTHRLQLPSIYNFYNKMPDSLSKVEKGYYSIIKPLFTTGFLSYRFLEEENFFSASQIILTSASSKTALCIAYMLFINKQKHGKKIIGLTSKRNKHFVQATGFYDQVVTYDDLENLKDIDTAMVDLGGNIELILNIGNQLADKLKFTSLIGLTDWKSAGDMKRIPNSAFFFAPDHATKLFNSLGPEEANKQINAAQHQFTEQMSKWLDLEFIDFEKELQSLYLNMLKGEVDPSKGYVVKY